MEKVIYKVEKINMPGKRRTPAGLKRYGIGDIFVCQTKEEYDFLLTYEPHHWKDAMPVVEESKPASKKNSVKQDKKVK